MTINTIFYIIVATLYLISAWGVYSSARDIRSKLGVWVRPAISAGLFLQVYLIYEALFTHGTPYFGLALALSITLFACTLILLIESFFSRVESLLVFILPIAAIGTLFPIFLPGTPLEPETASFSFRVHLLSAILAYSLMTIALIQALVLMALHNWLREGKAGKAFGREKDGSIIQNAPSVMDMEKMLFRLLWSGFLILSAAIVFGSAYTHGLFGVFFRFDHKTVTTLLAWLVFAVLLWGHHLRGWRGRFAARWVVVGFCMLMIAYIGLRLVIEVGR